MHGDALGKVCLVLARTLARTRPNYNSINMQTSSCNPPSQVHLLLFLFCIKLKAMLNGMLLSQAKRNAIQFDLLYIVNVLTFSRTITEGIHSIGVYTDVYLNPLHRPIF